MGVYLTNSSPKPPCSIDRSFLGKESYLSVKQVSLTHIFITAAGIGERFKRREQLPLLRDGLQPHHREPGLAKA